MSKLESIEVGIKNIESLIAETELGHFEGAINALIAARALRDNAERRHQMLTANAVLVKAAQGLIGQLRAHIRAMPRETTKFFDGLFFGSGIDKAEAAYKNVATDISFLKRGYQILLESYLDLDEPVAAKAALDPIVDEIEKAGLQDAIRKARLLPYSKTRINPEDSIRTFFNAVIHAKIIPAQTRGKIERPIVIDVKVEDFV